MRKLNELEKKVLKVLVNHRHYSEQGLVQVATVVDDHFLGPNNGISLMVDSGNDQVYMSIPEKDVKNLRTKFLTVIAVFNILKYLTDEGLIIIIGEQQKSIGFGEQYKDGQTSTVPKPISTFIADNLTKYILVTEELKGIVLSNYQDAEHLRHKETLYISICALVVSVLLGLYGVYSGYSTDRSLTERFENLIESNDINANVISSAITSSNNKTTDYTQPLSEAITVLNKMHVEMVDLNKSVNTPIVKQTILLNEHNKASSADAPKACAAD